MISGLPEPFFIRSIRNTFNAVITCASALTAGDLRSALRAAFRALAPIGNRHA